jgi:hypothetical protein
MRKEVSAMSCLALAVATPALADIPLPTLAVKDARAELGEGRQVELDVRVQYSGELLLFDSPRAMRLGLVYPYCISAGLAPNLDHAKAAELDGKRVQVKGTLLRFETQPDEPNTISTISVIDGMFFKNWCFGPYVLRIEELTVIQ